MAYEKTIWKNREVERPRTFEKIENPDGTITLVPAEGNIIEPGTPIIAENMNKIEQGIQDAHDEIDEHKAEKATQDGYGHIRLQDIPVKNVNGKTGEVMIDVPDIEGLNSIQIALGFDAIATENGYGGAISIGRSATSDIRGVAIGRHAVATGLGSVAIGNEAESINKQEGVLGKKYNNVTTDKWIVPGSFTVNGTKNFEIPHPKPEKSATHVIRHGAVESPTPGDTLYRYKIKSVKENDLQFIDLPDYFIWLNKDVQIFVAPQGHFGNGYGILNRETEQIEIHCQYEGEYNVLVIGTRNDDHQSVQDWSIKGVEREVGESWTGETYVFEVDEIMEIEEIREVM